MRKLFLLSKRLLKYKWIESSQKQLIRQISHNSTDSSIVYSELPDCHLPNVSLTQYLFEKTDEFGHKVALECGITGRKYCYNQIRQLSVRFGSALIRMGLKKGDVLGVVLPNCPEWAFVFLGSTYVGVTVTPANPAYTAVEVFRQFKAAEIKAVLCHSQIASMLKPKLNNMSTVNIFITAFGHIDGWVSLEDLLSADIYSEEAQVDLDNDPLILPYSSGTTGLPKGVILSHGNVVNNLCQYHVPGTTRIQAACNDYQEKYVSILPYFHIYGLVVTLLSGLWYGAHITILPRFDPDLFLRTLASVKPTVLQLVPPLISFLANSSNLDRKMFQRLHTVMSGAAPLGPSIANKLLERINSSSLFLQEGYGLTETSPISHVSPLKGSQIGSCGKPISRTAVKILDLETGASLPADLEGELCIKGPQVMKGYYKNKEATANMIDEEGWLHTGDIAKYDSGKRFYIVDRLKELIKVKGLQVAPSELEDLLRSHPQVMDVAVIGVPDERTGEAPRAYVVLKPGSNVSEKSLSNFVAERAAPYKHLHGGVVFLGTIPKSATGKILRRELKSAI
ncbi:uncharacterized protein LOC136029917 [Artemia franciscana]|uniref:Luciferin 4-monooxygenase n=1 Tax=Artemia franciscana TaxID=6661 RepID=A0AA88HK36_ARTSF|nr:hypothetical protein QYM36_016381 [Artemia franciscana]